jgi:hypothetical protein
MSYYLLFALKLEQHNSQVFYDPEVFVDYPINISVPEVKELVSHFIPVLETVAVVERKLPQKDKENAESNEEQKTGAIHLALDQNENRIKVPLSPVTAEAHVCGVKDLDTSERSAFNTLCSEITAYLAESVSKISAKNLLEVELSPIFSGLREAIDLRNYLLNYIENPSKSKIYQKGFIYIMDI